ncbi:predicted protein [Naegleria gruberi]|uniref:Predicted protein n=1 Tax=Naegleria gruberi TaxID=5762 RepID=D2V7Q1_NAEGR|nr:uncharacterized protein NAEGRDRAFT_64885 [Naegleria gruberi]EFC46911.1 predicted protein [Naegleria gruberi]|eukprot:XP_002679655.1 predicted protein [Naegleria gruberi strain NEG-M]
MNSSYFLFPSKNEQVWKEIINYCLSLIDLADSTDRGLIISYALKRFIQRDNRIKGIVAEKRENLIQMMIRLTRFPTNQTLLTNNHSLMVYWTLKLLNLSGAEKWDGLIEHKTTWEKIQGFYLKALVDTLPENLLDRHYTQTHIEPNEIVTEVFNLVNSCYLKNGDSVSCLFDDQLTCTGNILKKCTIVSMANTIMNRSEIEIDGLMLNSLARALKLKNDNNVCKLFSSKISSFFEQNPKQPISELYYSIIKLYKSKYSTFKDYCEIFDSNEQREFISNTIMDPFLDHYMEIRKGTDKTYLQNIVDGFEAFGKSSSVLDERMVTLLVDFGDNSLLYAYLHEGGYCQIYSVFETFASIIQNRGAELMNIMDGAMCNRLEKQLELSISSYNSDDGWFAVLCSALESGLFWNIIEKSRQLTEPTFTITEKFKQGYTLELVKKVRQEREGSTQDPSFYTLYCLWFLLMENIEKSNKVRRGKKTETYRALVNLSLIPRDYDCGNPRDSVFAFLLLAELEENVEENMSIILQNMDHIINSMYEQSHRSTSFLSFAISRLLENIERFLYHYSGRNELHSIRSNLKQALIYLPTYEHPKLLENIHNLLDDNEVDH